MPGDSSCEVALVRAGKVYFGKQLEQQQVDMYEGHSINKLQNGAIPLVFKIGKIRNMRFVTNLFLDIKRIFF